MLWIHGGRARSFFADRHPSLRFSSMILRPSSAAMDVLSPHPPLPWWARLHCDIPRCHIGLPLGLYTILPLRKLYGMYCNTGWSGVNTILRSRVGDAGGGVPKQGGCLRILVLIRGQRPRTKRISCKPRCTPHARGPSVQPQGHVAANSLRKTFYHCVYILIDTCIYICKYIHV